MRIILRAVIYKHDFQIKRILECLDSTQLQEFSTGLGSVENRDIEKLFLLSELVIGKDSNQNFGLDKKIN